MDLWVSRSLLVSVCGTHFQFGLVQVKQVQQQQTPNNHSSGPTPAHNNKRREQQLQYRVTPAFTTRKLQSTTTTTTMKLLIPTVIGVLCMSSTPSVVLGADTSSACQDLIDVFKSDDYKQCVNSLGGKWQTPLTFLLGAESPNKDVPEAMCKNGACQNYIAKVKSINADNCPFSHRGIDLIVKKADFELDRIDKACNPSTQPTTPTPTPVGACQELTDVFKSDDYKQCVNSLGGKWQTPLTFLLGAESPNKDVPEAMCKNDACQKYIAKVKSITADNCPFSHRGIDMIVKKADFELDRIEKACKNSTTPTPTPTSTSTPTPTPTGSCQELTDVFKSDDYKQCVNELKGKWQTPLTFLLGAESPNKEVPDTMCKNDACKRYVSKVKSINADNCPFSHRGIDMVVKKADFELDRIEKACGAAAGKSGSKSNENNNNNNNNTTTNPSTTTKPSTGAASQAGSSGDAISSDDSIVTPAPSSKPALRATPAPTKTSSATSSLPVVSSVLVLCIGAALQPVVV
ncbi:hypothetical protein PINS_up014362 [Pythium insidiosum]|nr:hypothetical protein PINS_up014362 [Pythium insidiosum]